MAAGIANPIPDLATRDRPGRPTLCTDALISAFEAKLRKSGYPTTVLASLGVNEACHSMWMERGLKDEENGLTEEQSCYLKYLKAAKRAVAERELALAAQVVDASDAGPQYWPAAMTYLERRHPERWGKRERIDPSPQQTPVTINFVFQSPQPLPATPAVQVIETQTAPALPEAPISPQEAPANESAQA